MIDKSFKPYLCGCFMASYRIFRGKHKNAEITNWIHEARVEGALKNATKEYFSHIFRFYKSNPSATYEEEWESIKNSEKISKAINGYKKLAHDDLLADFLMVYAYCLEEGQKHFVRQYGEVRDEDAKDLLGKLVSLADEMYGWVYNDLKVKNYWWFKNSATSLRKQLEIGLCVIDSERVLNLCRKYLGRDVNLDVEFMNDKEAKLMRELDETMYNKWHCSPYYFWSQKNDKGEMKLFMAPYPQKGKYCYVSYQNYTHTKDGVVGRGAHDI